MSLSVTKRVWIFSEQSRQTYDWLASQKAASTPCRPAEEEEDMLPPTPPPPGLPSTSAEEEDMLPPTPPPPGLPSTSAALDSETEELQVRTNVDLYNKMK